MADIVPYAVDPPPRRSLRGRGFLAVSASIFLLGLGHVIAGQIRRGLFWFGLTVGLAGLSLLCMLVPRLFPGFLIILPLSVVLNIWGWIDAYRVARRSPDPMPRYPLARYALGFVILAAAYFINPALPFAYWMRDHIAEAFITASSSMAPTIQAGDRFMVHKRAPYNRRWAIIALTYIYWPPSRWRRPSQ